jgi:hypothetical protein
MISVIRHAFFVRRDPLRLPARPLGRMNPPPRRDIQTASLNNQASSM